MGNKEAIEYLSKFPAIRVLLGKWIEKELSSDKAKHPLIRWLRKSEPNSQAVTCATKQKMSATAVIRADMLTLHHNHLSHLENVLSLLSDESRLKGFLDHLRSPSDFWQGYAEVECAALFKKRFGRVEIEPHLRNCRKVEFRFFLDEAPIYVEVAAPKSGSKFQDVLSQYSAPVGKRPKAFGVPDSRDRVKDAILQQFEHFRGNDILGLIVYNVDECEFDGEDIADRFQGTPILKIYTDMTTGESVTRPGREPDYVLINDPELENFGGVVAYERKFDLNGKVTYETDLIRIAFSISQMENIGQAFKP